MRDRFSEPELLAFIEDEMTPRRRAAFASRLEQDAALRARVDRMRDDRAALRALPEPELPVDFMVALEPQLARSVLVRPTPGAYRRLHRREGRRFVRLAIAAVFAAALIAGVWGAAVLVPRMLTAPGREADIAARSAPGLQRAPGSPDAMDAEATIGGDAPWPPADAMVHHRVPLPAQRSTGMEGDGPAAVAAAPTTIEAPLALVVPAADVNAAEALVERIVAELTVPPGADPRRGRGVRGAVVRNFDFDEAQHLVRRLERERVAAGGAPDTIAGLDGAGPGATNDPATRKRLLARLRRFGDRRGDDDLRESARLLGPAALAPDYERQLDFSGQGATHTVTLPVSMLSEFLVRLRLAEGQRTTLRALASDGDVDAGAPRTELQRWVEHLAMIRDFAADVGGEGEETYVMLPVVIEAAK